MTRGFTDADPAVAWAAGLFEGEGSCSISRRNRQPRVELAMTDRDAVERFAEIVGCGNVRFYAGVGPRRKDTWRWSVQGADDVVRVIGMLWPLLGERRRERATEVLERAVKMNDGAGFCARGHDLSDPAHLYVHPKTGNRHCRTCRRAYRKGWTPRLAS